MMRARVVLGGRRLLAFLLDVVLPPVILLAGAAVMGLVGAVVIVTLPVALVLALGAVVAPFAWSAALVSRPDRHNGWTPARGRLGVRVRGPGEGTLTRGRAILRDAGLKVAVVCGGGVALGVLVAWWAAPIPLLLDALPALADPRARALHDRVCGTVVVRARPPGPLRLSPERLAELPPPEAPPGGHIPPESGRIV